MLSSVLIIGGYGHFGTRIARTLATDPNIKLLIAGRNLQKAETLCNSLTSKHPPQPVMLDINSENLSRDLKATRAKIVVHTCGPFQHQNYHLAEACIENKMHYLDLADGRDFVCNITRLHERALKQQVSVVSGASTLPAVSSAVIDAYRTRFSKLEGIYSCISPGQKTPRGLATLQAVLSYCGKPFELFRNRRKQIVYGWQGLRKIQIPKLGNRHAAYCDVPDLALFPQHYAACRTVEFQAALELSSMQIGMWLLAALARLGLVRNWAPHATWLKSLSDNFDLFGSNKGGMLICMTGESSRNKRLKLSWSLFADQGHGPEIPCIPAIILAKKLAAEKDLVPHGAMPCLSLITLEEFETAVKHLDIQWQLDSQTND